MTHISAFLLSAVLPEINNKISRKKKLKKKSSTKIEGNKKKSRASYRSPITLVFLGGASFAFISLYCQIKQEVDRYSASRDNSNEKYLF